MGGEALRAFMEKRFGGNRELVPGYWGSLDDEQEEVGGDPWRREA